MVAGSKGSPRGLQFKRCGLAALLLVAGCGFGGPGPAATAVPSPRVAIRPSPSASPLAASSYWVLATLGLRLHQAADPASQVVTVVRPGAQLDATEGRDVAGTNWLHVHAHSSPEIDGWVVNDPLLLTTTSMQQHLDTTAGYSVLFPTAWTFVQEGPSQASFVSADRSQKLVLQTADSLEHLPSVPSVKGGLERQEGPVDIYGKSPLISYYRLDGGGYELTLSLLWAPGRAFQFNLHQPAADSSLLKQMLASVIIQ